MQSYMAPAGVSIYGGREAPSEYVWATGMPQDTWVQLPSMQRFIDFASKPVSSGGMAQLGYRGNAPLDSIVNAFCDPAIRVEGTRVCAYFYGGGHGDGTCNAVVRLDCETMTWAVVVPPTPPSVYLPQYLNTTAPIYYPSGKQFSGAPLQGGYFLTEDEGLDPVTDAGYIAPALSRTSTHMYGAAVSVGDWVYYFYNGYGRANVTTGQWAGHLVDLGAQLYAISTQYGTGKLEWGTHAEYDPVGNRAYVTLVGSGFRNRIFEFDPTPGVEQITAVRSVGISVVNGSNLVIVGRKLYGFCRNTSGDGATVESGFILDMDTKVSTLFTLIGDAAGPIATQYQEAIPACYDSNRGVIRRWNHNPLYRDRILSIDLTPEGGDGSRGSPYLLRQTARTVGLGPGFASSFGHNHANAVMFVYKRFIYHAAANVLLLLVPRSDTGSTANGKVMALKLS